jgi:hypothetical protein
MSVSILVVDNEPGTADLPPIRNGLLHWCYAIVSTIRNRGSPRIIRG